MMIKEMNKNDIEAAIQEAREATAKWEAEAALIRAEMTVSGGNGFYQYAINEDMQQVLVNILKESGGWSYTLLTFNVDEKMMELDKSRTWYEHEGRTISQDFCFKTKKEALESAIHSISFYREQGRI